MQFEILYDMTWAKKVILYEILSSQIMCYNFSKKFNFMHTSLMIFRQISPQKLKNQTNYVTLKGKKHASIVPTLDVINILLNLFNCFIYRAPVNGVMNLKHTHTRGLCHAFNPTRSAQLHHHQLYSPSGQMHA